MKKRAIRIFIMTVFICVACQTVADRDQPSQEPTPPLQLTSTSPVVPGVTVTPEATPTPAMGVAEMFLELNRVPPGQYLVIYYFEDDVRYLEMFTPEMISVNRLQIDTRINWISTSSSGNQLLMARYDSDRALIFDVSSQGWREYTIRQRCTDANWSPDGRLIALSCINRLTDIYILDTIYGTLTRITNCEERHLSCGPASWSFDGQWLAYLSGEARSGTPSIGVYLFDTGCIDTGLCMEALVGPLPAYSDPTWTPTNELALLYMNEIHIYDIVDNTPVLTQTISTNMDSYRTIRISPDGEYLSLGPVNQESAQIYSLTENRFGPLLKRDGNVINIAGWVVIP